MRSVWVSAFIVLLACGSSLPGAADAESSSRHVQVRYAATVKEIPADAHRIRVWVPYPQSGDGQTVGSVTVDAPYTYRIEHEPQYGNAILYLEGAPPPSDHTVTVSVTFDVVRREQVNRPDGSRAVTPDDARALKRFRSADQMVPIDGKIAEVAREATRTATGQTERARAIYDYVTTHLRYDKSGTGWGRGDAIWACDAKRGNCTDFHSLLIGMARSVNIPAKFEIGLPLPDGESAGKIPGYHCWAKMYLDGIGWVPMDSSEASKVADKRDYFFGAVDANRVRLSTGRDIVLEPHQDGPALNYFVYPYVEVDGKPFGSVTQDFSFRDL